jgi:prevent-host-death family protein
MAIKRHRTQGKYSIAEARHNLARIVHEAEAADPVELTRRGRSVAVLVSMSEYERLQGRERRLWEEIGRFREREDVAHNGVEPETFEGVRDRGAGREVQW